jgi:hypothetical protein
MKISKFDSTIHDGRVVIGLSLYRGIYVSETISKGSRNVRTAGMISAVLGHHDLLAMAFISGLRTISRHHAENLAKNAGIAKARIEVVCRHRSFLTSLETALLTGRESMPLFRPELWTELVEQTNRFDLSFTTDSRFPEGAVLQDWAVKRLWDARTFEPNRIVQPSLISTVA